MGGVCPICFNYIDNGDASVPVKAKQIVDKIIDPDAYLPNELLDVHVSCLVS